jgi:hypothetical protein
MSQGYRKLAIKQLPKTSKSQTPEARYWKKFRVRTNIMMMLYMDALRCKLNDLRSDPDSDRYDYASNNFIKITYSLHRI